MPLWAWDDDIDDPAARPQGVLRRPTKPLPALTATMKTRFASYRLPTVDGCARWTGSVDERGRGRMSVQVRGRQTTVRAARVAYRLHHGRDPQGRLELTCGNDWCIEGRHLVDDRLRAEWQQKAAA